MQAVVVAQGNGNGNGGPSLQDLVRSLTESEDAVDAGIRTMRLLAKGEKGRRQVCQLMENQGSLSGVAFQGILRALVGTEERSPEVLDTLFRAYAKTEVASRRDRLRRAFIDYDEHKSLLDPLLRRLSDVKANGSRLRLLGLVAVIAKEPDELLEATGALISLYEVEAGGEFGKGLQETLVELTGGVEHRDPQAWRSWFEKARQRPKAFVKPWRRRITELQGEVARLKREREAAVRKAHQRAVAELIAHGVLPLSYLDAKTAPSPEIRVVVLEGIDRAAAQDQGKRATAVLKVLECLRPDETPAIQGPALDALVRLGSAGQLASDIVKPIRAGVEALLEKTNNLDLRVRGVRALQVTGDPGTLKILGALYKSNLASKGAELLRKTIVSVAFNLTQSNPHALVRGALNDPAASVREIAANCLGSVHKPEYASEFARALAREKDAVVAAALLVGLDKVANFKPKEVVSTLLEIAANPSRRGEAMEVLLRALASTQLDPKAQAALQAELLRLYRDPKTTRDVRQRAIKRVSELRSLGLVVLEGQWLAEEKDSKLCAQLVAALLSIPKIPLTQLLQFAGDAAAAGRETVARGLLEGVIARASAPVATPDEKKLLLPARRQLIPILLKQKDGQGARKQLEAISAKDRDLRWSAQQLRACAATGDRKGALQEASKILANEKAPAPLKASALAQRASWGFSSRNVALRSAALGDAAALKALKVSSGESSLVSSVAHANEQARGFAAKLDDPKAAKDAAKALLSLGAEVATPWVLVGLSKAPPTSQWLGTRLTLLRALHPKDASLKALILPKDPKDQKAHQALKAAIGAWGAKWAASGPSKT